MLTTTRRDLKGTTPKNLRKQGQIPLAIVGHAQPTISLQAPITDVRNAFRSTDSHGRIEIKIEGEPQTRQVIVKQVDADALKSALLHVTFQEVAEDDVLVLEVPVVAVGHSTDAERSDVIVNAVTDLIKLKGKISNMPENVEVDVSKLHVGDHFSASDLTLPAGVELSSAPETILFTIQQIAAPNLEVTPEAEATAEAEAVPGTAAEAEGAE